MPGVNASSVFVARHNPVGAESRPQSAPRRRITFVARPAAAPEPTLQQKSLKYLFDIHILLSPETHHFVDALGVWVASAVPSVVALVYVDASLFVSSSIFRASALDRASLEPAGTRVTPVAGEQIDTAHPRVAGHLQIALVNVVAVGSVSCETNRTSAAPIIGRAVG